MPGAGDDAEQLVEERHRVPAQARRRRPGHRRPGRADDAADHHGDVDPVAPALHEGHDLAVVVGGSAGMDGQRRALRGVRRLDQVGCRRLLGDGGAGREEEPRQFRNQPVVEGGRRDEAMAHGDGRDRLGRPRRRAAEGAADDLELLERGRALGDGVRLADRDEDRLAADLAHGGDCLGELLSGRRADDEDRVDLVVPQGVGGLGGARKALDRRGHHVVVAQDALGEQRVRRQAVNDADGMARQVRDFRNAAALDGHQHGRVLVQDRHRLGVRRDADVAAHDGEVGAIGSDRLGALSRVGGRHDLQADLLTFAEEVVAKRADEPRILARGGPDGDPQHRRALDPLIGDEAQGEAGKTDGEPEEKIAAHPVEGGTGRADTQGEAAAACGRGPGRR